MNDHEIFLNQSKIREKIKKYKFPIKFIIYLPAVVEASGIAGVGGAGGPGEGAVAEKIKICNKDLPDKTERKIYV